MKNIAYIHIERILLSNNNKKLLIHATAWVNLKNIIVSERSQIQKSTYTMFLFIWSLRIDFFKSTMIKSESGCLGMGVKNCLERGMREPFYSDNYVLYFVCSVGCICSREDSLYWTLKIYVFIVCQFYFNKKMTHTKVVIFFSSEF